MSDWIRRGGGGGSDTPGFEELIALIGVCLTCNKASELQTKDISCAAEERRGGWLGLGESGFISIRPFRARDNSIVIRPKPFDFKTESGKR